MSGYQADRTEDTRADLDRGELLAQMEPLLINEGSRHRPPLADLTVELLVGVSARHGRRIVASLTERGVLVADSSRAPLRLAFPATLAPRWTPGLFPDRER